MFLGSRPASGNRVAPPLGRITPNARMWHTESAGPSHFRGLPTTRPSGFRDRRVTGVTRSGRQTSHNQTSGQSPGRRARRSAVAQDHLRHGDSHELSESDQLPARRQLESYARVRGKIEQVVRASSRHDASGPGSGDRGAENPNPTPLQGVSWGIPARRRLSGASAGPVL